MTEYDELIAALRFCDGGECDGCCEYKKEHGCNTLLRDAADAIEALSMKLHGDEAAIAGMKREIERMVVTGADKPKWIPVTERLPEFGEEVLAVRRYMQLVEIITAHIAVEKNGHSWWSAANITHWMPLPNPPGEEPDA